MAFTDQAALAVNSVFKARITLALVKTALAVIDEDPVKLKTPTGINKGKDALHAARCTLASSILSDPAPWAVRFALAVAADPSNAGISDKSTDDDLMATTAAVFNAFAVKA